MTRQEILAIAKPILFNTEMVEALLEGRKTVTRRVVKPQPVSCIMTMAGLLRDDPSGVATGGMVVKPPCQVGDYLYVRETWTKQDDIYKFLADNLCFKGIHKFSPSIHMPKEAARIFLRVTDVRVERLREIDHAIKIAAEGADIGEHCCQCIDNYVHPCCTDEGEGGRNECNMLNDIRCNFVYLWDSTIKKQDFARYGWAANPWVWVIEFERVNVDAR